MKSRVFLDMVLVPGRTPRTLILIFKFFKNAVASLQLKNKYGARAGIRTRVDGMKTRNDGPGYTTRATANRPTTC